MNVPDDRESEATLTRNGYNSVFMRTLVDMYTVLWKTEEGFARIFLTVLIKSSVKHGQKLKKTLFHLDVFFKKNLPERSGNHVTHTFKPLFDLSFLLVFRSCVRVPAGDINSILRWPRFRCFSDNTTCTCSTVLISESVSAQDDAFIATRTVPELGIGLQITWGTNYTVLGQSSKPKTM